MKDKPTVYVVDDDEAVHDSLRGLIDSTDLNVETYPCAEDFLDAYDPGRPGCLVLDVRLPGMSGLELQKKLVAECISIPIIFMKPLDNEALLDRIEQCIEQDRQTRRARAWRAEAAARLALLTAGEREVMDRVVAGKSNKVIAAELSVSQKTVEAHRARVMEKMQADSLADLIRMVTHEYYKGIP